MPCTNECGKTTQRQNLETHIANQCPLTIINCDFKHVGCEVKLPRKDMPAHITENVTQHVSLHTESYKEVISQLKEENKQLEQQVAKLTQDLKLQQICTPICPAEFTMINFEQHKLDDDEWISPPFYTHPKGYKMDINVRANNFGSTPDNTVIGVRLMKGECDDQLKWPFHGTVTIKLLSQEDKDFYAVDIHIIENKRVLKKEDQPEWPSVNLILYTLQSKYTKNDCLKLCAFQYKRF